jgi:hypothetical protein
MIRVRQALVLLAVTLILVNVQCVAVCAATQCDHSTPVSQSDPIPPCHRHHAPKPSSVAKPCPELAFLVDSRTTLASAANSLAFDLPAILPMAVMDELRPEAVLRVEDTSPPLPAHAPSITILRV